jgi:hypothetical protein
MPCHGCGQAAESPAFPLRMHRIGAVAHKSSTCLCTDSREAVLLPGWQAAADRPAGACVPGAALGTRLASPGSRRAMSAVSWNAPVSDGATRERELPWATRPELSDRSLATRTTPATLTTQIRPSTTSRTSSAHRLERNFPTRRNLLSAPPVLLSGARILGLRASARSVQAMILHVP